MTTAVQRRRGTNTEHATFTGLDGEITVNTTTYTLHVHDGATVGGIVLAKADGSNLVTSSIDINGGTIDGTVIGATTPAAGSFTTISASGEIAANGGIALPDNQKATFGASDDLQIYHDTVNSVIKDAGTGNLELLGNNLRLKNADATNSYLNGDNGGSVTLYYAGSEKLATTSTGIDVTGTVTADGLTVDGGSSSIIQSTGAETTLEIKAGQEGVTTGTSKLVLRALNSASGTNYSLSEIASVSAAGGDVDLFLRTTTDSSGPQNRIKIDAEGDISFYDTSGSNEKFFWDASAESLGIGTTSPASPIDINRSSTDGTIATFRKDGTTVGSISTVANNIAIGKDDTALYISAATDSLTPVTLASGVPVERDGGIDIGRSSARFKDLYRSGSTISTSDRTMKQDIRDLTEAEHRVAVACKPLLKSFRYIQEVETQGESAPIRFGIIAQELETAFTAEGLNADHYAMFRRDIVTDENGVETQRLGVCYENLLAFIIAAI